MCHYYITAFSILQEAFCIFGRSHKFPLLLITLFFVKGEQNYVKPSTNLRHPLQEYLKNKKRLRQPDQGTTVSVHGLTRASPPAFVQSIDTMIIAHFQKFVKPPLFGGERGIYYRLFCNTFFLQKTIDFLVKIAYNTRGSRLVVVNDYRQKGLLLFLFLEI